jgi:hypothetical protein
MANCEQTKGQSVLQHGESVKSYTFDLINHLRNGSRLLHEWRLPDWLITNKDLLLGSLPTDETLDLYTRFHDIGKPYCLEIDSDGKRHFPNHAEVSFNIFKQIFNDDHAAELIRHDMDIHLLKADGVEDFCKSTNSAVHLLVGLAEIHSNAQMFGGIDSTSFKIKWKCLNQRGKQIINLINQKNQNKNEN